MKVAIITCYKQPNYIRAKTLRSAIGAIEFVESYVIKNRHTGSLKYVEIILKTMIIRMRHNPDVYVLTFRGYEMILPIRLLTMGKKLIYDEFINPIEWAFYEHGKFKKKGLLEKTLTMLYGNILKSTDVILTDTQSHAELSAMITHVPLSKYRPLPVSADEKIFSHTSSDIKKQGRFNVFYYGNMLPLHGIDIVLEAASSIAGRNEDIIFTIVGGKKEIIQKIKDYSNKGAKIHYKRWVEFDTLPQLMQAADICLAGPFGNTTQSQYVITGKAYQLMQTGKPIIIGANKETGIFVDKQNALVVQQGDSEALAAAIEWAYKNKDKLHVIGEQGYELYKNKFSVQVLSQSMKKILQELEGL